MASSYFLPLTTIAMIISQMSMTSIADQELMIQQCHNSDNPTLCLRCLTSNSASLQADSVGLGRIILTCMTSQLLILAENASTLASTYHAKPKAASALQQCGLAYATAKRGLEEADAHLIAADYDKAAYEISMTTAAPLSCHTTLVTYNINVPPSFRYNTEVYLGLTQALLRIIDRF